ncbi:MAG: HAMP domain-containing histidine kinase [Elusimicrobia bacterium]|nr:HAMP domain-containing histidine kinase [Elusimicrobiota bacterium]
MASERLPISSLPDIVVHDIKNPLSCIQGCADTLLLSKCSPEQVEIMAHRIVSCCQRIEWMADDLLSLNAGGAQALTLRKRPVALAEVLRETVDGFEALCRQREVALLWQPDVAGVEVLADPLRLQQALANLLGNSLSHVSRGGRIAVSVTRDGADAVISVRDDGTGVAPEHRQRVFDESFQVSDGRQGSRGLGLYITKLIAEGHGGCVRLGPEGPGALFQIILPVLTPPTVAKPVVRTGPGTFADGTRVPLLVSSARVVRPAPPEAPPAPVGFLREFHSALLAAFGILCAGLLGVALRPLPAGPRAQGTDPFLFQRDPVMAQMAQVTRKLELGMPPAREVDSLRARPGWPRRLIVADAARPEMPALISSNGRARY